MELFIQQYLLLSRQCPIPGLGTLHVQTQASNHLVAEHSFQSPKWSIVFDSECKDNEALAKFISKANHISLKNALSLLHAWVSQFTSNPQSKNIHIPGIGRFKKEAGNHYSFTQDLPSISLPDITARKIVRTDAVHQVLVGDTQHTNVYMAEQMQKSEPVVKISMIWLWVLLITLCSFCIIAWYAFQDGNTHGFWGNKQIISVGNSSPTYKVIP